MAIYQAVYTWLILDFAGLDYIYVYSLVASFFKIVPLISTWMIGAAGGLQLYLTTDWGLLGSIGLFGAYFYADSRLGVDIFNREITYTSPYVLGLSVFMGLYAFSL